MQKKEQLDALINNDMHAPRYHFIAPEGKCMPFDPNGAIFWKGKYHLFYIFQDPALPNTGDCWGHASSTDLLTWKYHPTALAPAPGDPEVGIYSGCALVNKNGVPTIVYHGVKAGTCIAMAEDDDLIHWRKSPHNPVIPEPKEGDDGFGVYRVFDPHVWIEGDSYYAILGGKVKPHDLYDTAYLFRSDDLIRWEYLRPFYNPNPHWTNEVDDCACPDFFRLGDRYALVCISHYNGARYYLGRYRNGTFVPEEHHWMNWPGGSCFAPETLLDGNGRRVFWAWVPDGRNGESIITTELGVMTIPRILSLDDKGRMLIEPAEELEQLRGNHRHLENITVPVNKELPLQEISGDMLEIALEAKIGKDTKFGMKLRVSHDGAEETVILFNRQENTVSVDSTRSSLSKEVFRKYPICAPNQKDVPVQIAPFELDAGEPLKVRIFLDKSIIEIFVNGRQCITQRIYPTKSDSLGVVLFSKGGVSVVNSLDVWDMNSLKWE